MVPPARTNPDDTAAIRLWFKPTCFLRHGVVHTNLVACKLLPMVVGGGILVLHPARSVVAVLKLRAGIHHACATHWPVTGALGPSKPRPRLRGICPIVPRDALCIRMQLRIILAIERLKVAFRWALCVGLNGSCLLKIKNGTTPGHCLLGYVTYRANWLIGMSSPPSATGIVLTSAATQLSRFMFPDFCALD
jgi:hypothetical protein